MHTRIPSKDEIRTREKMIDGKRRVKERHERAS
jgi:hypothetical protein